jgi:hypothetical protein
MNNGIIGIGMPRVYESAPVPIVDATATDFMLPFPEPPFFFDCFIEMVSADGGHTSIGTRIQSSSVYGAATGAPYFTLSLTPGVVHVSNNSAQMTIRNYAASGSFFLTNSNWRVRVLAAWLTI